ncbi:hypothetical protein FHX74_001535 [Friedmanniella endophytica]|uniref:Uncharacterized protein n=1 Tax=Microlunatus kandeliicorticis TaxID=1759536 RepID=A0A7W3IRP6_9ACTN|nr:hypothetical protein [Microlunatus kandeliicorticis]MBA8793930.1 hypothetical protein [Microlunatus kandeliicorticis]
MSSATPPRVVGFGTFAALPGAAIGFCGTFTYLLALIVWQVNVDGIRGTAAIGLMPQPAEWVTSVMYFTAYGLPSSAVLGALLGLVVGWLLGRTTRSSSPALGWVFGTVAGFVIVMLLRGLLAVVGLHEPLGQSTRLFAVPMLIFLIDGGVLGVWLQARRSRMVAEAYADEDHQLLVSR